MKMSLRNPIWISLAILGLVITGCVPAPTAGPTVTNGLPQAVVDNPVELVNQLSSEISQARVDQLNVLSPGWFKKAENAFFSAQKDLEKGNEIADISQSVTDSRDYLKKAQEIASVSRTTLAEAIKAREMARDAGGTKFEKEYQQVENDFLDLTRSIERNNLSYA